MGSLFKTPKVEVPEPPDPNIARAEALKVQKGAQRSLQDRLRRQRSQSSRGQLTAPGITDLF